MTNLRWGGGYANNVYLACKKNEQLKKNHLFDRQKY